MLQLREAERATSSSPRSPGVAAGSLPLLRPIWRRRGGGTPDLLARDVNRVWNGVAGGGACVGAAAAHTAWCSPPSELLLAGVLFTGGGRVGVLPRGRLVDADDFVRWRSCPWAPASIHRRLLQRRWGLAKVRRRMFGRWLPGGDADPGAGWWLDGGGLGRLFGCPDPEWCELGASRRPTVVHRVRSSLVAGVCSGSQRLWLGALAALSVGLDGWFFLVFSSSFLLVSVFDLVFDLYLYLLE